MSCKKEVVVLTSVCGYLSYIISWYSKDVYLIAYDEFLSLKIYSTVYVHDFPREIRLSTIVTTIIPHGYPTHLLGGCRVVITLLQLN